MSRYRDRPEFPHFIHFALTVGTCGLWWPIWVLCYILRST